MNNSSRRFFTHLIFSLVIIAGPTQGASMFTKEQTELALSNVFCQAEIRESISSLMRMEDSAAAKKFSPEGYELFKEKRSEQRKVLYGHISNFFKSNKINSADVKSYLDQTPSLEERGQLGKAIAERNKKACPEVLKDFKYDLTESATYIINHFE